MDNILIYTHTSANGDIMEYSYLMDTKSAKELVAKSLEKQLLKSLKRIKRIDYKYEEIKAELIIKGINNTEPIVFIADFDGGKLRSWRFSNDILFDAFMGDILSHRLYQIYNNKSPNTWRKYKIK